MITKHHRLSAPSPFLRLQTVAVYLDDVFQVARSPSLAPDPPRRTKRPENTHPRNLSPGFSPSTMVGISSREVQANAFGKLRTKVMKRGNQRVAFFEKALPNSRSSLANPTRLQKEKLESSKGQCNFSQQARVPSDSLYGPGGTPARRRMTRLKQRCIALLPSVHGQV